MNKYTYNSLKQTFLSTPNATMSPSDVLQSNNTDISSSGFEPVDTTFVVIMLSILSPLAVIAVYMHYLVLKMSRRDKPLLNCLLSDCAWNFLVGGPIWWILSSISFSLSEPAKEIIGAWFCDLYSIIGYIWLFNVWIFSLLLALFRYLYVVHYGKIMEYGLARVENIFRILFWAVPISLMILHISLRAGHDPTPWISYCYGWPLGYSSSTSWWYKVERQFCIYNEYGFTNRYVEYALRLLCALNVGVCVFLFSNLTEAVLYYRTYLHLKT